MQYVQVLRMLILKGRAAAAAVIVRNLLELAAVSFALGDPQSTLLGTPGATLETSAEGSETPRASTPLPSVPLGAILDRSLLGSAAAFAESAMPSPRQALPGGGRQNGAAVPKPMTAADPYAFSMDSFGGEAQPSSAVAADPYAFSMDSFSGGGGVASAAPAVAADPYAFNMDSFGGGGLGPPAAATPSAADPYAFNMEAFGGGGGGMPEPAGSSAAATADQYAFSMESFGGGSPEPPAATGNTSADPYAFNMDSFGGGGGAPEPAAVAAANADPYAFSMDSFSGGGAAGPSQSAAADPFAFDMNSFGDEFAPAAASSRAATAGVTATSSFRSLAGTPQQGSGPQRTKKTTAPAASQPPAKLEPLTGPEMERLWEVLRLEKVDEESGSDTEEESGSGALSVSGLDEEAATQLANFAQLISTGTAAGI